jgi:hypothetical protein
MRLGMPPAGTPATAGPGDHGGRKPGQGDRGLLGIGGRQHDTDPLAQVIQVQPAFGVVLAQQGNQPLAVSVPEQRVPAGWHSPTGHAHAAGLTTTAVPYATTSARAFPISEESKRTAITALAPSNFALSIIRSSACRRASSRITVNCETSPWRSDDIPPATVLVKPIARTTRPKAMPRFRSTTEPGSSNAVVTGNAAPARSGVPAVLTGSVMQGSTPPPRAPCQRGDPPAQPFNCSYLRLRQGYRRQDHLAQRPAARRRARMLLGAHSLTYTSATPGRLILAACPASLDWPQEKAALRSPAS